MTKFDEALKKALEFYETINAYSEDDKCWIFEDDTIEDQDGEQPIVIMKDTMELLMFSEYVTEAESIPYNIKRIKR